MDFLFYKICFFSSIFGFVWVDILTANRGLLDRIPMYYPKFLADKPLGCGECLSGWISLFAALSLLTEYFEIMVPFFDWANIYVMFLIIMAPITSIAFYRIITK